MRREIVVGGSGKIAGGVGVARGRLAAGWWLFTAAVALALVAFVHFLSGEEREAPIRDIYAVYDDRVWGVLALVVLYGLVLCLAALFVTALLARRKRV